MLDLSAATAAYREMTGHAPAGLWSSPGRVNLIGDHTDYNDGLALPAAIDRSAVVAAGLRADAMIRCTSRQVPTEVSVALDDIGRRSEDGWALPMLGALWGLRRAGVAVPGIDLTIDSTIPMGGGLASSAALGVATALAVTELTGQHLSDADVARCCQDGEGSIAGAPTGLMDQLAVLAGRTGYAVFLDCRTLERELVPFRPGEVALSLVVIDTSVAHSNRGGGYRARREESAQAAGVLGVHSLRDATLDDVEARLSGMLQRRARHVLTENARVRRTVELLRDDRVQAIGGVLEESHASLRDDYEVSSPELDAAVVAAHDAGAWGARMTGAGLGGCAIALVPSYAREKVAEAVRESFARQGFRAPTVFDVTTADGARRCD
jgi:galactokinase